MKTWEIYRYTCRNVCDDSYYGKQSNHNTIGFVTDSEDNVKALVDRLNTINHSYYAREPEDEWDEDCEDADYIAYKELHISTIEGIEKMFSYKGSANIEIGIDLTEEEIELLAPYFNTPDDDKK